MQPPTCLLFLCALRALLLNFLFVSSATCRANIQRYQAKSLLGVSYTFGVIAMLPASIRRWPCFVTILLCQAASGTLLAGPPETLPAEPPAADQPPADPPSAGS